MDQNLESPPATTPSVHGMLSAYGSTAIFASVASTLGMYGVLSALAPLANSWIEGGILAFFYLGLFFYGVRYFDAYNAHDWSVPAGSEHSNWPLRRKIGHALGALGILATVVFSTLYETQPLIRALLCGQATVMAVAGCSDLRYFRLPLPLMFAGIGFAIALIINRGWPFTITAISIGWAVALIVILGVVAKAGIAMGDQIVMFWIALASPFNGLISVMFGQLTMDVLGRVVGWKAQKKRVPIGGAWLLATVLVLAAPQFPQLMDGIAANAPVLAGEIEKAAPPADDALFRAEKFTPEGLRTLSRISREASYLTGRISFEEDRGARIALAQAYAGRIAVLQREALLLGMPADVKVPVARSLGQLSQALKTYDLDLVRAVSYDIAAQRDRLNMWTEVYPAWRDSEAGRAHDAQARAAQTPAASTPAQPQPGVQGKGNP
jgi:hypothetical protein